MSTPETEELQAGHLLAGKYEIVRILGRGGMGAVYEANHSGIGRKVAIKVMHRQSADPMAHERFRLEARAAAAVGHPGLVDVLDLGELDDGTAYLVMERLSGETLGARLEREKRLTVEESCRVMALACDALDAVHRAGVLHRDLKPDNLFLCAPSGAVKLLDFGVAKFVTSASAVQTVAGMVVGTALYMSPEQAQGAADAGPPTDLYAVGCILMEALTGQPPFPGEDAGQVMRQHVFAVAPSLASRGEFGPGLVELVDRLLDKDPNVRPQPASDIATHLRELASGAPPKARKHDTQPEPPVVADTPQASPAVVRPPRTQKHSRRRQLTDAVTPWRPFLLSAGAVVGLGTAGLLWAWHNGSAASEEPDPTRVDLSPRPLEQLPALPARVEARPKPEPTKEPAKEATREPEPRGERPERTEPPADASRPKRGIAPPPYGADAPVYALDERAALKHAYGQLQFELGRPMRVWVDGARINSAGDRPVLLVPGDHIVTLWDPRTGETWTVRQAISLGATSRISSLGAPDRPGTAAPTGLPEVVRLKPGESLDGP